MMHGYNSSHMNTVFFPMQNHYDQYDHEENVYASYDCTSPSVDCTLSLGTPSTRLTNENDKKQRRTSFFDVFRSSKHSSSSSTPKSHRGSGGNVASSGGDPLSARRCANCDTTSTPLWRNGPRGPKSLCNACGIRFKKEERRATAAAAANGGGAATVVDTQHMLNSSWVHHHQYSQPPQRIPCFSPANYGNEFSFIQDNQHDADTTMPFYSWHLNVPESHMPGLVHDYTR